MRYIASDNCDKYVLEHHAANVYAVTTQFEHLSGGVRASRGKRAARDRFKYSLITNRAQMLEKCMKKQCVLAGVRASRGT